MIKNVSWETSKWKKNRFKLLTVSLFKVVLNDECSSFKNKEKKCLFLFMIKMRKNKKKFVEFCENFILNNIFAFYETY